MDNSLCFMVQARLGSTRLPQKMILPFHNETNLLDLVLDKLQANFPNIPIILATSTDGNNDLLEAAAQKKGCSVFRGSENDVLARFVAAANHFNKKKLIRVCADNPFLDVVAISQLIALVASDCDYDYVSFTVNDLPSIKSHFGFWTEYVTVNALEKVSRSTSEPFYHEHVTNFIYENANQYQIKFLAVNPILEGRKDIRLTLDTPADFNLLKQIYADLFQMYGANFGIDEIVPHLDKHPEYKSVMTNQIAINSK